MSLPSTFHGKKTTKEQASLTINAPSESHALSTEAHTIPVTKSNRRAYSSTSADISESQLSASFSTRVRARLTPQSQQPPLHLQLPSNAGGRSRSPEPLPTLAESPLEKPSAPIDIPARKRAEGQGSRPTTPLTARAPQGEYFTSWRKTEPRINEFLVPSYSSRAKHPSNNRDPSVVQRGITQMRPKSYGPSSPLSPKMSTLLPSTSNSQKAWMPAQGLDLAALPKYHPANYPSKISSQAPPSSLGPRSTTLQPRSGRKSDAKRQLLQYQRDIITNTAKNSRSLFSSSVISKPNPPRLNPLGSPCGPMTPFMLEDPGDYLAAGSGSLPANDSDGRELVERLIRRENERRNYPEARSGSVSPALSLSPAVSPAGGRG